MEFRIADTFTDSLARLTAQEQKAVKMTAFELQLDPSNPGLRFHKLDSAKDKNFWSIRVNDDVRVIVHKTAASFLLCYVAHHDKAYEWAERRRIERHPSTGAMQLVEIRQRVEERPRGTSQRQAHSPTFDKPKLFDNLRKAELMSFGVPEEWVDAVRNADEDELMVVLGHLPPEAAETLLQLAVGEKPEPRKALPTPADPFAHPDAQRRFRMVTSAEELARALDAPWEKWAVFLHPDQRQLVERSWNGPVRVSGSAGTGKTIVAIHRATHLARKNAGARVLLTTFSPALAAALRSKLNVLTGDNAALAARIEVGDLAAVATALYTASFGKPNVASPETMRQLVTAAMAANPEAKHPLRFVLGEWRDVVDARQIKTREEYEAAPRLGRKTRLPKNQREILWRVFAHVLNALETKKLVTTAGMLGRLSQHIAGLARPPFDFAVVDEAQDLGFAEARFLKTLAGDRPEALFFAGDLGQRIFQLPFSWLSLGIDIRGRSHTLRVNYRTSHQIRAQADGLLPDAIADVDGVSEKRKGTISVFNGPRPAVTICTSAKEEAAAVAAWVRQCLAAGVLPQEIAVIVRSETELPRARDALSTTNSQAVVLGDDVRVTPDSVSIATMHLAKGLEFKAVAVMACDDGVLPLRSRIETVADEADLEEAYDTERHLLYVACTRARDHLLVTGVAPGSEFLADLTRSVPKEG